MPKQTPTELKQGSAGLLSDTAPAGSIDPSEHRQIYDNLVDSLGVIDAVKVGAVITLTLADGTTVTITEQASSRPSGAQYHATLTPTSARPDAAALTVGVTHRDSADGEIAGWPAQTTNAWLWIWSSHTLSHICNGDCNFNQVSNFEAPVRLMVGAVNGYLYRSTTILYPAATNENWRVS